MRFPHPSPLPFLLSQKLYILRPGVEPEGALHPQQFHASRWQGGGHSAEEPEPPDASLWEELPRQDLLNGSFHGQPLHRVVLTTDAGLGKTYNLHWLRHELNRPGGRRCAFLLPIGELRSPSELIAHRLVPEVRNVPGNNKEDPNRLQVDLERLRDRGHLVLLCDGLDMASDARVQALARLIEPQGEWGRCRIVVAGRPFALEHHWEQLVAGRPWQFVQVGEFNATQQRTVLGKLDGRDRYDFIPGEARNILTTPRVLEYLQPLGAEALQGLRTVADVYWQASGYMLAQALGGKVDRLTSERLLALLGSLAFTMYAQTGDQGETGELRPNLDRIPAQGMTQYLKDVEKRMRSVGEYDSRREFLSDLEELDRLNVLLSHGWLDVRRVGGEGEALLWRNASLQEFFAAYWATRWGQGEETQQLRDWVVEPLTESNRGFYWLWRFATEMPDEAILASSGQAPSSWLAAMAPLYDGSIRDKEGHVIRSTEFLYRSWDRVERWAPGLVEIFRREFQDICAGTQGAGKKETAQKMLAGFIPLVGSGKPGDSGTFIMGALAEECPELDSSYRNQGKQDNPEHRVTLTQFLLHRFCLTNLEYELFDARHQNYRWWGKKHPLVEKNGDASADDNCPVVIVSWYDSWCMAKWLGLVVQGGQGYRVELPTEAQWEYACRAGRTTPFTFHKGHKGQKCTPDVCNFHGDFLFPEGVRLTKRARVVKYRGFTIPVDGLPENLWGFFQMHGNVWEWCLDWYEGSFYKKVKGTLENPWNDEPALARVLRGGSWGDDGRDCRSARRYRYAPRARYLNVGFRLAAVPAVGAEQGKAGSGA